MNDRQGCALPLEELMDFLEDRLGLLQGKEVQEHLEWGCNSCQRSLLTMRVLLRTAMNSFYLPYPTLIDLYSHN